VGISLASLLHARRDRIGFVERLATMGDVVQFRLGRRQFFLVSHPEPARHVLRDNAGNYRKGIGLVEARTFLGEGMLTADGEVWAQQRREAHPWFHAGSVDAYAPQVGAAARRMVERWHAADAAGLPVDGMREAGRATLEVLLTSFMGATLSGREGEVAEAFAVASAYAVGRITALSPLSARLPTRRNRSFRSAIGLLHAYAEALLRPGEGGASEEGFLAYLRAAPGAGEAPVEARRRRDKVVTLLLAGHETTATAVAWSWHLLANDADAQARVHEEAGAAFDGSPSAPVDPTRLPFTIRVVKEAMRLYPPVWLLPRVAVGADRVGGEAVPAGAHVVVSPYTIHRHPALWTTPERFEPDRFDSHRPHQSAPHAYLPFGLGERACIGARLAMLEAPTLVAAAVARFHLAPDRASAPVRPEGLLTLRPRGGLPLCLRRRGG
jgi:cytochrome P450